MELEELRDALKIASAREYALIEELLVCVDKKSLIKQIRQTEKMIRLQGWSITVTRKQLPACL